MKMLSALLGLLALAGACHADLKSDLNAHNKKLDAAMKAKDLKGLESLMRGSVSPDFRFYQDGKSQDFKTFIGNLTMSIAMMETVTVASTRVLGLAVEGAKGVMGASRVEHTLAGTMRTPDKKVHTTRWVGVFGESYRKVGGQWKTVRISTTSQKYWMDGKPVKM